MIAITGNDVLNCVTYADVVEAIEESFLRYEKKDFNMPPRMHIDYGKNAFLLMPCFSGDYFSTKLVSVYPDNAGKQIPVVNGVVVLNNAHTGEPLALLNGKILTALRTGAVGAVGVKYVSPENVTRLGIVGAGAQAFYQVMCTAAVRKLTDIWILSTKKETGEALAKKLSEHLPGVRIYVANSADELLKNSEVVITATTSATPVLPEHEELLRGKHYVGIGSFKPDVQEFPQSLFRLIKKVYVDTEHAAYESGDVLVPLEQKWITKEQVQTLGSYMLQQVDKNTMPDETTFFKSVGMAAFDLVVSQLIYHKALEKGLGQQIEL